MLCSSLTLWRAMSGSLFLPRDTHHRRPEQAFFEGIVSLQNIKDPISLRVRFHRFNHLVQFRVELLAFRGNLFHTQPSQSVLQLPVDQLDAGAEFFCFLLMFNSTLKTVQNR